MAERPRVRFPTTICSLCAQDLVSKRSGEPEELISCADCGASGRSAKAAAAAAAATAVTLNLPRLLSCRTTRPSELLGVRPQAGRGREAVPVAVQRMQAVPYLQPARRRRTSSPEQLQQHRPPANTVDCPSRSAPEALVGQLSAVRRLRQGLPHVLPGPAAGGDPRRRVVMRAVPRRPGPQRS